MIIYLPLEDRSKVIDGLMIGKIPQIVFYNHHIQLNRRLKEDLESKADRGEYDIPVWVGPYTNTWGWLELYYVPDRFIEEYIQKVV